MRASQDAAPSESLIPAPALQRVQDLVSLVDRLVHRCEVLSIDGESYRRKEALERATQKAASRGKPALMAKKL